MLVQTKEIEMKPEDVERIFQSEDYKAAAEKGLLVSFLSCYSSTIPLILPLSVFQMTVQKPKYFLLLFTCDLLKAREKSRTWFWVCLSFVEKTGIRCISQSLSVEFAIA